MFRAPQAESDAFGDRRRPPRRLRLLPIELVSLVAVIVFLTAHVTIVLHIAFGEMLADIIVALDVP